MRFWCRPPSVSRSASCRPRGIPGGPSGAGTRFAFFAFPWNAPATTIPVVVAKDAAENETTARFNYKLFPKSFRHETIHLTEDFLKRVVPEIQSQSQIASQGDLLKDFLDINGRLRRIDGAMLVELAGESKPETLWKAPSCSSAARRSGRGSPIIE